MISCSIINNFRTKRTLLVLSLLWIIVINNNVLWISNSLVVLGFSIIRTTTTTRTIISKQQHQQQQYASRKLYATVINDPSTSNVQNESDDNDDDNDNEDKRRKRTNVVVPYMNEPLAPHTFAGMVEQRMIEKFGSTNIERILQSWRLLEAGYIHDEYFDSSSSTTSNDNDDDDDTAAAKRDYRMIRQYCQSYVPGLVPIQSFWNTEQFTWSNKLKSNYQLIKNEFVRVTADMVSLQEKGNNIWAGALTDDAGSYGIGWKTLVLMDRGVWDPVNVNLFPITSKVINDAKIPAVEVFFASMEPNTSIQLHSDFTNFVLTCHLGLIIPESGSNKCRLTVGNTTNQWINGNVMIFDTSLMHDAVNDSNETRYILMLRIWHPSLTTTERDAIQFTYHCLDIPALVSNDPIEREQAEQFIQQRMKFPLITSSISSKTGFGTTSSKTRNENNNNNKKKSKSSSKKKK